MYIKTLRIPELAPLPETQGHVHQAWSLTAIPLFHNLFDKSEEYREKGCYFVGDLKTF